MEIAIQIIMRKFCALFLVIALASSSILCAPAQQQAAGSLPSSTSTSSISSTATTASIQPINKQASSSIPKPTSPSSSSIGQQLAVGPRVSSASFGNQLRDGAKSVSTNDQLNTFDGKNPFADDSLWQIPFHLVRDLGPSESAGNDNMAKSASETSADEHDYSDEQPNSYSSGRPSGAALSQSSASAPTVISATTDLKTAAGYHYPTHGYHSGGHAGYGAHGGYGGYGGHGHDSGHYGDHHGGHYGGKYFQYASVPYPYAWDFGYRRGNPYHTIERYEHGKGPHFQTKVKWSDKNGGYGVHVWDYNHDDHHSHHYGGHYDSHAPSHYGSGHHGGHYGGHYGGDHYGAGHH